jgi:hypothetical protein
MMAQSLQASAVKELGKQLVLELDLVRSVDTLGRWMAHHVAELVHQAENASTAEERTAKEALAREAILELWAHRFSMPSGARPFEKIEPILRTLESLELENGQPPRYFSSEIAPDDENVESNESMQWLALARGIDNSSKLLISYFLSKAAEVALDKSATWVKLAEQAGVDETFDFKLVRFLQRENELHNINADEALRGELCDRLKKLDAFLSVASALAEEMRNTIAVTEKSPDDN